MDGRRSVDTSADLPQALARTLASLRSLLPCDRVDGATRPRLLKTGTVDLSKIAAFIPAFVTTLVTLRTIAQGFTSFLSNPASLLAPNGKLVLLIDDLDRCSPEKIRDVIEAINFLVTAGECYILLGMAHQVGSTTSARVSPPSSKPCPRHCSVSLKTR
jgi:KAP family P-loop domain